MSSLYWRDASALIDQVVAGKKRTIRLGKVPKRSAEKAKRHIESIAAPLKVGDVPTPEDRQWIALLEDSVKEKLVRVGCVNNRVHRPACERSPTSLSESRNS